MSEVNVRAKTIIKLSTANQNIDLEFQKGDKVKDMTESLIHALVQNIGTEAARSVIHAKLAKYKSDYKGLGVKS